MNLRIIPLSLAEANDLVARVHRHLGPAHHHKFSIGAMDREGKLRGAAIVGRPAARMIPQAQVLEVSRLVTDGTHNAASILYAAAARIAREMGYERIQTYTLSHEPGTSLEAAGWSREAETHGRHDWRIGQRSDGSRRREAPPGQKIRWGRELNPPFERALEDLPLFNSRSEP